MCGGYSYSIPSQPWTLQQVDLSSYAGVTNLALRFLAYNRNGDNFWLDFQLSQVFVAEGGAAVIMTDSPLPDATVGYPYSVLLQATNGSTPYYWQVVSNSLPPGLALNPNNGLLSGTPTNLGTYNFWINVTTSNYLSWQKPFSLTVQENIALTTAQSAAGFVSPGTNVIYCQVDNETQLGLLSLVWTPTLPATWSIINVQGDGSPALGPDGKILFQAQALTNIPLRFSYAVSIPAGESQTRIIGGSATFLLSGFATVRTRDAAPLLMSPRTWHSADCNTNWVINSVEAGRVLAYWRARPIILTRPPAMAMRPGRATSSGPCTAPISSRPSG